MDGTLTREGQFTPLLLQALSDLAAANIPVLIVTGRSAGWVNGLASYLPVVGAIAENGGLFYRSSPEIPEALVPIPDLPTHRRKLADMFQILRLEFPQLQESADNLFRLTDWTFDVQGLTPSNLQRLQTLCQQQGWSFTYSTVQCHIKPLEQDKAAGLMRVLQQFFPDCSPQSVLTVGDSPNDESLFNPDIFPNSVGVANILHYMNTLTYRPAQITLAAEVEGFCELASVLLRART